MYLLPGDYYREPARGCGEKVRTYLSLAKIGLPVLKSVIISNAEVKGLKETDCVRIKRQLEGKRTMLRYIYDQPCHKVKNGGKILDITREALMKEVEPGADFWLLEASRREDNRYCCNICVNKRQQNVHLEIVGKGFDISDINKGEICPHEVIDIPFPVYYGAYGDWWKWARFYFCTQQEYENSVFIRKERLGRLGTESGAMFYKSFKPVGTEFVERIFGIIQRIEVHEVWKRKEFYNVSCSFELGGRVICWDIQTPEGKTEAYG